MNLRMGTGAVAGTLAFLALAAGAAAAPANLTCNGDFSGTYQNVTVPAGADCELAGATVMGNVQAHGAKSLEVEDSRVRGNVQVANLTGNPPGEYNDPFDPSVSANQICDSNIGGDLQITNSGPGANWFVNYYPDPGTPGETGCQGMANQIGGNLQFMNNAGSNDVSFNTVGHDLQGRNNGAQTSCANNLYGGHADSGSQCSSEDNYPLTG